MAVIQPRLISLLANDLSNYVHNGRITLNGQEKLLDIYKTTIEGTKIKKYLYLVEEIGNITGATLLDATGTPLAIKPLSIQKSEDGILIAFEFNINLTEV